MSSKIISPPGALAVTIEAARKQLKREADDASQDDQITVWLAGITSTAEKYVRRAFITQTRRLTLDTFNGPIKFDCSPLLGVTSIKFVDDAGVEQVLDPADYMVDTASEPGFVVPASGTSWPATSSQINSVTVDFTCGYGPTPETVPPDVRLYILAKLVSEFGPSAGGAAATVGKPYSFIDTLLDDFIVYD